MNRYPTKEASICRGHQGSVLALKFSSDGSYCVSGGSDKTLRLWNPHKSLLIKTYTGHGWEIYDLTISTDNARIASCGGDRLVFLWDVSTGRVIRKFQGHTSRVNCVQWNLQMDNVPNNPTTSRYYYI
jgi:mitogen-activated protein kinase organizer 1